MMRAGDWFAEGGFLVVVLGAMAVEAVALVWLHRRTGRGVAPGSLLPGLAAGALMVAACGAALRGGGWLGTGALLLAAGGMHALDLRGRWRR